LFFAKLVFSEIRFWQMIGRGTRHDRICKHRNWLPAKSAGYFLIFDFWSNFDWFGMHPEDKEEKPNESVPSRFS
jgi:type I restriction enzyme R subunit